MCIVFLIPFNIKGMFDKEETLEIYTSSDVIIITCETLNNPNIVNYRVATNRLFTLTPKIRKNQIIQTDSQTFAKFAGCLIARPLRSLVLFGPSFRLTARFCVMFVLSADISYIILHE